MKKLLALGLVCFLPAGLAAEDAVTATAAAFGTVNVLVIDDSAPARDVVCAPARGGKADCLAVHRAVLTARIQKVSALRERGRWL